MAKQIFKPSSLERAYSQTEYRHFFPTKLVVGSEYFSAVHPGCYYLWGINTPRRGCNWADTELPITPNDDERCVDSPTPSTPYSAVYSPTPIVIICLVRQGQGA